MLIRFLICWLIVGLLAAGCASTGTKSHVETLLQASLQSMEEQWGIKVTSLHLAAGGNLVDFRYRVIDPKKAANLFKDKKNKPYLIDLATGAVLSVPELSKIGSLRTSPKNMVADKVYFIMFANPMLIHKGSKATVVIGDFRAENLTVE